MQKTRPHGMLSPSQPQVFTLLLDLLPFPEIKPCKLAPKQVMKQNYEYEQIL